MNAHHCRDSRLSRQKEPKKVQFSTTIHKSGYRSVQRTSSYPSSLKSYIMHVHHFLGHRIIQKPNILLKEHSEYLQFESADCVHFIQWLHI